MRSLIDRTLYVLGRATVAAAPAGLLIWFLTETEYGGLSLLAHAAHTLDPIGCVLGLDGVILLAFLLAFPANELVLPLILSGYAAIGMTPEWSMLTCLNLLIFTLFHFPCATTVLTIKKEAGLATAFGSIFIPTLLGCILCILTRFVFLIL